MDQQEIRETINRYRTCYREFEAARGELEEWRKGLRAAMADNQPSQPTPEFMNWWMSNIQAKQEILDRMTLAASQGQAAYVSLREAGLSEKEISG